MGSMGRLAYQVEKVSFVLFCLWIVVGVGFCFGLRVSKWIKQEGGKKGGL